MSYYIINKIKIMNKKFWVKKIIGFTLLAVIIAALLGYTVMLLWNHILVAVVSVSVISFWQAMGILVLSKILFGGFHGRCGSCKGGHWKNEMKEKWHGMSEEEREKIKQEWKNRCRVWKKADTE
jgi:Ca2+/H+ antiporter, TMEM165/GDT1 family